METLYDKVKLFEELGELAEAEKARRRIAQVETIADNCAK